MRPQGRTTPNTFVATANVGHLCGADVDFVDIDPDTFNMCATALETKLTAAQANGRLPKVIAPFICAANPAI